MSLVKDDGPGHGRTMSVIGYGFIGRRVAIRAASRGWKVRALSRTQVVDPASGVEMVVGDAREAGALKHALAGCDHVVFAAGTVKPAESNHHPLHEVSANLGPLVASLEAVASERVSGFTLLSSGGTVYGPNARPPTPEDAPVWPISSYGVLKVAAERYVNMYAQQHGFGADILRCANVYGPGEPTEGSQGLIGVTRSALQRGRPVVVYGDGSARRDFVHVDDVSAAVEELARSPSGVRVLNVGSGRSDSVLDVIGAIALELGVTFHLERRPARATDVACVQLDISQLLSLIDFAPRDLTTGLGVRNP